MQDKIIVRGAREHNLKNITVEIPRNKFVVITGISGSGKSTLAFDTIYAEGQRRYVESLSAYARQFLGLMNKPDVDSIEGLSPAISIEQKTTSKNPRSTVGTVTEIYDYLRLLFARIGIMNCPKCSSQIKSQSAENIVNTMMSDSGSKIAVLAPIIRGIKGRHEHIFPELIKDGFSKVRVDGKIYGLEGFKEKLARYEKHWIEAVVDRIEINNENRHRLTEAVEQALHKGKGSLIVLYMELEEISPKKEIGRGIGETVYSSFGACPNHPEIVFESLEPRMFSFNSPFGACQNCLGLGARLEISPELLIPDKSKSILEGAIKIYGKIDLTWRAQQIAAVGRKYGFDVLTPIEKFTARQIDILLYGTKEKIQGRWHTGSSMNFSEGWEGIIPQTMRLYRQTESESRKEEIEELMTATPCEKCRGRKLKDTILAVKVCGKSIIDVTELSIEKEVEFFNSLPLQLSVKEQFISRQILKEINDRLGFLNNVGLGYLTLSRSARTLSGGEAQRIRLATQIGSNLMGVLYILDEPSIGLHQRDNQKLISTLQKLRDLGNTLIVVEHDEDTMRSSDYLIDMGPGAGMHGGNVCARGTPIEVEKNPGSLTGRYLAKELSIPFPKKRRESSGEIAIKGASENNLKNLNVSFPTQTLCGISGVSGSGKSSLMSQTLIPALKKHFGYISPKIGAHKWLSVSKTVTDVVVIDQDPIGKTPRSNPATYTKLFDVIRMLFAMTKEARSRGYKQGRFSFNVEGGRCEACKGDGLIRIEMNFLPDVFVQCEECSGKRYNKETLNVLYKERSIADVLDMSVEGALLFFENIQPIKRKLQTLFDVGLGYIKLGQSSTTLSGGESQRIKLTRELAKVNKGKTLYLLDEPTTGLHFEDVRKLVAVLNRLVEKGNTVYVIEHNLDVLKNCDYIIDLGPFGGDKGGEIIAQGTPEEIAANKNSFTGMFLKRLIGERK